MTLPFDSKGQYAPWQEDEAFQAAYAAVKNATIVGFARCWELWDLVLRRLRPVEGDILEVGTYRGGSGALIARANEIADQGAETFLCDTFTGIVKAGAVDKHKNGQFLASQEDVEAALRLVGAKATVISGTFPDHTGHLLTDRRFRFCHVDVDVYQSAEDVWTWVWPRLSVGGMIVYDDYGFASCPGVTLHVNDKACRADALLVYNHNRHGLLIKRTAE